MRFAHPAQFITAMFSVCSVGALAQETPGVLPTGIFRARVVTALGQPVTHSYNSSGVRTELLAPLNLTISARQQAEQNADLATLYDYLNTLEAGLGDSLFQTDVYASGTLSFQRVVTALEYGVNSRTTFGILVPVVNMEMKTNFAINTTNQVQDILDKKVTPMGAPAAPLAEGLQSFAGKIPSVASYEAAIFTDKGYEVPRTTVARGLGDIELGGKYQFLKTDAQAAALTVGLRVPSATHMKNPAQLMDRSTGDGQYDVGLQAFYGIEATSNLNFGTAAKLSWQLPENSRRPVPSFGQSGLTDLNNSANWDNVRSDLGDSIDTEISSTLFLMEKSLNFYGAFQSSFSGEDKYSGTKNLDYASLGADSASKSHRFEVGTGYSTIPAFRRKAFAVPMEVKMAYSGAIYGTNTPDTSFTRFDLIVYF